MEQNLQDIINDINNFISNKIELFELVIKLNDNCKYSKINDLKFQKCEWTIKDLDFEKNNYRKYCHQISNSDFYRYKICSKCEKILNEFIYSKTIKI